MIKRGVVSINPQKSIIPNLYSNTMERIVEHNKAIERIVLQVAEVAQYLWQKGWAERNAGNMSVNIDDLVNKDVETEGSPVFRLGKAYPELANKLFFVTGTGKRMRDLARNPLENALFIRLTGRGDAYHLLATSEENKYQLRPTSELPTHLGIHQMVAREGRREKVVMHTHANELVALTQNPNIKSTEALNRILWGMHPETMVFVPKGVGFIPYFLPGTQEIAGPTIEMLKMHDIVLWEKHGVFAIGQEILDTFDNIDIICKSAKIWFMCKQAGFEPEGLTEVQLDDLRELVKKFASQA